MSQELNNITAAVENVSAIESAPDLPIGRSEEFAESPLVAQANQPRPVPKVAEAINGSPKPVASPVPAGSDVEPFPVDIFPAPLRRFLDEAAAALGCPPDFLAVPMLSVLGTAIGNSRALEVKKNWNEGPRIYCAVVAKTGTAKTPALDYAMKPMSRRQEALMSDPTHNIDQVLEDLKNPTSTKTSSEEIQNDIS